MFYIDAPVYPCCAAVWWLTSLRPAPMWTTYLTQPGANTDLEWSHTNTHLRTHIGKQHTRCLSLAFSRFLSISPTRAYLQNSPAILGLDWLIWPTRVSWFRWIDFPLSIAEFSSLSQSCVKPNSLGGCLHGKWMIALCGEAGFPVELESLFVEFKTTPREMDPKAQFTLLDCLWFAWSISRDISCVGRSSPWPLLNTRPKGSYLLSSTHFIGWFNKCPCWCLASWDQLTGYSKNSRPISW